MSEILQQEAVQQRVEMAVEIGVLKEQMRTVLSGHVEMKATNALQTQALNDILMRIARVDGAYRAVVWLGGLMVTLNGIALSWLALALHK